MKKIATLSLIFFMGLNNISNAQLIDHTIYEAPLSSSIKLKKVIENYGNSYNKFNMLEVDLNDKNNSIDVLFNTSGLYKTMSIKNVASNTPQTVGAVNADFFHMQSFTSSIGAIVKDHRVLSSPAENSGKYAVMIITDDNKVSFEYLNPYVILKNITRNNDHRIYTLNKLLSDSYKGITIRTSDYSYTTFGKNSKNPERVEIIVGADKIVKEIRQGQEAVQIPYGGFAIMSYNVDGTEIKNSFAVGDKVDLTLDIMQQRPTIKTIIGGGSVLIKNGQKTPITSTIPGKAQRTAAAITKDNKLILFTNDGRLANSSGLDEKDVQNYFYSLGIKDAMIFDGGGSTEMYVDGKVQNFQYGERAVINAIAVKNTNQTGQIAKVNVTPLKNIIYTGDEVEVIVSAQDVNGSKATRYNTDKFTITTSGVNSQITKRGFKPTTSGNGTVNATVEGVSGKANITVLASHANDDRYKKITNETKKFNIYPNMDDGSDLVSKVIKSKITQNSNQNENYLVLGNNDNTFTQSLKGQSQNINIFTPNKILQNTVVISINNTTGLYKNPVQWTNIQSALSSNNKNIIIALQGNNKIDLSLEEQAFNKMLENSSKDKNIYVIYKGSQIDGYKKGNVSYISLIDMKNQNYSDLKNPKYLEMYEDANGLLVYNFKSMI